MTDKMSATGSIWDFPVKYLNWVWFRYLFLNPNRPEPRVLPKSATFRFLFKAVREL